MNEIPKSSLVGGIIFVKLSLVESWSRHHFYTDLCRTDRLNFFSSHCPLSLSGFPNIPICTCDFTNDYLGRRGPLSLNATDNALADRVNESFLKPMESFQPLAERVDMSSTIAPSDPTLTISAASVFKKHSAVNSSKAQGDDEIPGWLLKRNADLLADPIQDVLNPSYQERRLPAAWKKADIVPISKQRPIYDINKHLRPISPTPLLSKLVDDYVVEMFVKPAVLAKIGPKKFETILNSSTVYALIDMIHSWLQNTDGNGATTRLYFSIFVRRLISSITLSSPKNSVVTTCPVRF